MNDETLPHYFTIVAGVLAGLAVPDRGLRTGWLHNLISFPFRSCESILYSYGNTRSFL